LLPNGNFAEIG